jgi:hypothetical protein
MAGTGLFCNKLILRRKFRLRLLLRVDGQSAGRATALHAINICKYFAKHAMNMLRDGRGVGGILL